VRWPSGLACTANILALKQLTAMAKIVHIEPGQVEPNQEGPAAETPKHIEITVTPNPTTRAQRRMNNKAVALSKAQERQGGSAPAPHKLSPGQLKARRKREREIHHLAAKAGSAKEVNRAKHGK
jgi:hypothetical protein